MSEPQSSPRRIDTHHHFMPTEFVKAIGADRLASVTPDRRLPQWSIEAALALCEQHGVEEAILSISPGYPAVDKATESRMMHECNEAAARIRSDHKGRFGHFASIPLFDPADGLREIARAFGELAADGVIVCTNYDGIYLGDPRFEEVWQELDRRNAIVFIHPNSPTYDLAGQPPQSILEFPFETTRTATSLIYAGVTRRHPNIRFILSHAGGALPFLASRAAGGAMFNPQVRERVPDFMAEVRKFWFDTALSGNPAALAALAIVADPERIIFGTDYPYAPSIGIAMNVAGIDHQPFNPAQHAAINRGNAARLLGRAT